MSKYRPHEFIGGFLDGYFFDAEEPERAEQAAQDLLSAMKVSQFAVVELPEHQVWDGPGQERYWRVDDTTVSVDKHNVATVTICEDWNDLGAHPDQLRALAAALLAAAEQVQA